MKRCFSLASALAVVTLAAWAAATGACIDVGFYDRTCPSAEALVQQTVVAAFVNDSGVAPAIIRLHFHDCFVKVSQHAQQGCDGSVLIDSTPGNRAEKDSAANNPSLRFFDVVDRAKAAVEAACPGVVSCADILAFAARDSVVLSGGLGYQVPSGRRDGRISTKQNADGNLPGPDLHRLPARHRLRRKNLTLDDIVILSGAHTIGVSHCSSFSDRLYKFNSSDKIDPALSKAYAFLLKGICPPNSNQTFPTTTTLMDLMTPVRFDNKYYLGLVNNLGLFESDAALLTNATMRALVDSFVRSEAAFRTAFARSMIKMGQIEVLSGSQGEIRRNCRVINPTTTQLVAAS